MRRLLALAAFMIVSGCGGSEDRPGPASTPVAAQPTATPATAAAEPDSVGKTDGRLGDATVARRGEGTEVAPGGPLNATPGKRPQGASGVSGSGACDGARVQPSAENVSAAAAATLCLVNAERTAVGLGVLRTNDRLARAARVHAVSMVEEGYFSHTGSDGSDVSKRAARTGYTKGAWHVGENLAWGTGSLAEPRSIVVSWMNSRGHRENVLRSAFEEIGVAVVPGNPKGKGGGTFVTVFGRSSGGGGGSGSGQAGGGSGSGQPSGGSGSGQAGGSTGSAGTTSASGRRARALRRCRQLPRKRRARCRRAARR